MKSIKIAAIAALGSCLVACGGNGDDDASTGPTTPPAGTTTYPTVTPKVGATESFVTTRVDNSNNTVNGTYTERVASANADGSYAIQTNDPTGSVVTVDGITYRYNPTLSNYDTDAHLASEAITLANGSTQNCAYTTVSGEFSPYPSWVGQGWAATRQESCTPGTVETIVESGSVQALESVTVPAGTFTALKSTSVQTWTDANGQNITETTVHWSDPAYSLFTIKTIVTYVRSGNVPTHYVTTDTIELQSRSGG